MNYFWFLIVLPSPSSCAYCLVYVCRYGGGNSFSLGMDWCLPSPHFQAFPARLQFSSIDVAMEDVWRWCPDNEAAYMYPPSPYPSSHVIPPSTYTQSPHPSSPLHPSSCLCLSHTSPLCPFHPQYTWYPHLTHSYSQFGNSLVSGY